jgi:cell division initiation protein
MPPPPQLDVQNKTFTRAMRGYAIDEVDAFLDQVTEEFGRLRTEIVRLEQRPPDRASQEAISRALIMAERMAGQTVETAKAEAQALTTEAEAGARRAIEAAEHHAREIVEAAEQRVQEVESRLAQRRQALEGAVEALSEFELTYRDRLRGCVEAQLKALEDAAPTGPVAPPLPPGLEPPLPGQ